MIEARRERSWGVFLSLAKVGPISIELNPPVLWTGSGNPYSETKAGFSAPVTIQGRSEPQEVVEVLVQKDGWCSLVWNLSTLIRGFSIGDAQDLQRTPGRAWFEVDCPDDIYEHLPKILTQLGEFLDNTLTRAEGLKERLQDCQAEADA